MDNCNYIDKLRTLRFFNMPYFDWIASLLFAILFGKYIIKINQINIWIIYIILWIIFGVIVHWILKIDTMLGYYLGINKKPIRKNCI